MASRRWAGAASAAVLGLFLFAAGALAWLWFFPGPTLRAVAAQLSKRSGLDIQPGQVTGNLVSGFSVHGLKLGLPQAEVSIPSANIRLDWRSLLRRKVAVQSIELVGPRVRLLKREAAKDRALAEAAPPWAGTIAELRVVDGVLEAEGLPPKAPQELRVPELVLRYGERRLEIERARFSAEGSTYSAKGAVSFQPFAFELVVDSTEPVSGRWNLRGTPGRWDLKAVGAWQGLPFALETEVHLDHTWRAALEFSGLEPARWFPKAPKRLGALSGRLHAEGRGFKLAAAEAKGGFEVAEASGPLASGDVQLSSGQAVWKVLLSSAGLSGSVLGSFSLDDKALTAAWTLSASTDFVRGRAPAWEAAVQSTGSVKGSWPQLDWTLEAWASNLKGPPGAAAKASLHAEGRGLGGRDLRASGRLLGLQGRQGGIDSVRFQVAGSTDSHAVELHLAAQKAVLFARGRGRLEPGRWTAVWSKFEGRRGPAWRSTQSFTTVLSSGAWSVAGLSLANGKARLSADAEHVGGGWKRLQVKAESFNLESILAARLSQLPLQGVVDATLDLRGELSSPEGRLTARVEKAAFGRYNLGELDGRGRFGGGKFYVERLDWAPAKGSATAAGVFPLRPKDLKKPDFDLRVKASGLDLAFLSLRLPGAVLSSLVLDSDLRLKRAAGALSSEGSLSVRAQQVSIASGVVVMGPIDLKFEGAGDTLKLVSGVGRSGKGEARASGSLGLAGPNVEIKAAGIPFHTHSGIAGLMDAQLKFFGPWTSPIFLATVNLPRADYVQAKKKEGEQAQEKASSAGPTLPSNMAVDVRIKFDSNVWYRSGDTSIETKGNLALQKESGTEPRFFGTIETVRGAYVYYGRNFEIVQGRLIFDGELPPNPLLNVRAEYLERGSGIKVMLNVDGSLQQPKVTLSSEPPMEERDIISVLAFGKPLYEVSSAKDQASVTAAAEVVGNYVSQQLRENLLKGMNLDMFRVRVGGPQSGVTLGRYVAKNLFVSYDQSVGGSTQGTLGAEYTLSPNWSLTGHNSTDGRYILDLLFKYGIK